MNVETGADAAQFPEKEYISGIAVQCRTQGTQTAAITWAESTATAEGYMKSWQQHHHGR